MVQLFLKVGGEVVFHITGEEGFQEGGDNAATVFRNETFFLQSHIFAFLKDGNDAGIGGRASDSQFFQLFHKAGFGIARRRLREMLVRHDLLLRWRIAFRHAGQQLAVFVIAIVAAFLIQS